MIISIGNNKGGVGKTTVTCNLAVALARQGKRVLVVDNDSQANATQILLGSSYIPELSMYDLIDPESANGVKAEDVIVPTTEKNVFCIPNQEETSALDIDLGKNIPKSFFALRNKIRNYATENFHFTLIDNPPTIGLWLTLSLVASDFAIVPIDVGSGHSLQGLTRVLKLIEHVSSRINHDLKFLKLLVNKVDKRTLVSRQMLQILQTKFPGKAFETTIPVATVMQQAELLGTTIFRAAPTSRAASAYRTLARELLEIVNSRNRREEDGRETKEA